MPSYTLSGVEVEFPYEAYSCQLDYMTKVIQALQQGQHALLESPTGTGKTLCLLCATLAWRNSLSAQAVAAVGEVQQQPHSSTLVQGLREAWAEHKAAKMAEGGAASGLPQIVYSSRTHSQLQQVMRELKNCSYKPRTATVASRQHSCLHPVVSTMQSGINQACRALTSKRACKWHNGVEKFMRKNPDANTEVLDIEDLGRIGESRTACPYYIAREMAATADIVFMPYNYMLDAKTRAGLGITWQNAVLIFDEAHNVEQVCADSMSFDLPAATLAAAIEELGIAAEVCANKGEAPVNVFNELGGQDRNVSLAGLAGDLQRGRAVLCRLEQEIAALQPKPDTGFTRPGAFLFELLGRCGITMQTWRVLQGCLALAMSVLTEEAVEAGRRNGSRNSAYSLQQVGEVLRLAFVGTAEEPEEPPPPQSTGGQWPPPRHVLQQNAATQLPPSHVSYRVHVHLNKNKNGRLTPTLSYWCFSPGLSMQQLTAMQVRSILLTSGTLSPLDSFASELSLPFPVRLENPHVISREQVWVGVVPQGPSGQALNSSFQNRDNPAYKSDLGLALVNFCRNIPDGLLVFFPSYALLTSCINAWKQVPNMGGPSIWERIAKSKQPVIEPRESAAFNAAADDFRAKLLNPAYNGAVFFAVTRGKASEGLDFSDAAGRAVVLTGIPYPMKMDPKVRLKQEILNEARAAAPRKRTAADGSGTGGAAVGLSGDQWYSQNAMRAVNQAVGRVIRHRRDYGAIILCDERFRAPNVQRQLSCWLRDQVTVYNSYGAANASLVQFFKQQGVAARKGLVDGGSLATVPGQVSRPGPFTAATAAAADGKAGGTLAAAGSDAAGRRTLLQSVPAAIDAVGMTELFAPVAAAAAAAAAATGTGPGYLQQPQQQLDPAPWQQPPANDTAGGSGSGQLAGGSGGGASRLMAVLGTGGSNTAAGAAGRQISGQPGASSAAINSLLSELDGAALPQPQGAAPPLIAAAGPQQGVAGSRAAAMHSQFIDSKFFEPRPWERAALAASARPCPPRVPLLATAGGGGSGANAAAGNVVGPAHLVAKYAERQRQRSASLEPEQQQVQGAVQRDCSQQRQQQLHSVVEGERQQQQEEEGNKQQKVTEAPAEQRPCAVEKAAKHNETVLGYLTQLKATLAKEPYDRVRSELKQYSQHRDVPRLLAATLPLLAPHPQLLDGFRTFLPKAARGALEQKVAEMQQAAAKTGAGSASTAAGRGGDVGALLAGLQQHQQQQQQPMPAAQGMPPAGSGWQRPHYQQQQHHHQQHHQQAGVRTGQQAQQPLAGLPTRQPLAQQQTRQQQHQRGAPQQQKKLQQLVSGRQPQPVQQPPAQRAGGNPHQQLTVQQQQQRGAVGPPGSTVLMPPRGMQQAIQSAAAMRAGSAAGLAAGRPPAAKARGPPCPVCNKAPMDAPHEAGCGHSACYACWLKALAQFKCPVCSRAVRKNQLAKKYFA